MSEYLKSTAGIAAGVLVGALGSLAISHAGWDNEERRATAAPRTARTADSPQRAAQGIELRTEGSRIAALDERLTRLEEAGAQEAPAREPPSEPPDPEEWRRHHEELHQRAIDDHNAEPEDPSWAPQARTSFEKDLMRIGTSRFFPVSVSCKTSSCVATLEWKSYDSAVGSYESILHGDYDTNCGRQILLPEPKDKSARYQATAVFDCTSQRSAS